MFNKRKAVILIISLIIVFLVGFFGSFFTTDSVSSDWYISNKPSFTPPNYIFGPVWTILYLLIGLSLYFAWVSAKNIKDKKKIAWIFGVNLILNGLWSIVFFGMQNALLAFLIIIGIWLTIWAMIFVSWKLNKLATYLLVPYLLWVTFAGVLNLGFL